MTRGIRKRLEGLFVKTLEGINVIELITNISSGVGAGAPAAAAAGGEAAPIAEAKKEEKKKKDERKEFHDDMNMLFGESKR